jgi:hypothetical protein
LQAALLGFTALAACRTRFDLHSGKRDDFRLDTLLANHPRAFVHELRGIAIRFGTATY